VPIDEVPEPQLDKRWAAGEDRKRIDREAWTALENWLTGRGLRMVTHE
jgi:hypothetical protein